MTVVRRIEIDSDDLAGLTIVSARDLVVRCFFEAQQETFSRAAGHLRAPMSDDELKKLVEGAVRLAFRSSGGDFEAPTRESLMAAVEKLAAKAAGMGTPADVIEYHRGQLAKVFAALS